MLSESGLSGFWDFQDGFNPEHPQILQILITKWAQSAIQTVTNYLVYSVITNLNEVEESS
jgi:hypothetical protein